MKTMAEWGRKIPQRLEVPGSTMVPVTEAGNQEEQIVFLGFYMKESLGHVVATSYLLPEILGPGQYGHLSLSDKSFILDRLS